MADDKAQQHKHLPSPGEQYSQGIHTMRMPHMEFVYRIVCQMTGDHSLIDGVQDTNISRLILPIAGGTVSGPNINGIIVPNSGADWAQLVGSEEQVSNVSCYTTVRLLANVKSLLYSVSSASRRGILSVLTMDTISSSTLGGFTAGTQTHSLASASRSQLLHKTT